MSNITVIEKIYFLLTAISNSKKNGGDTTETTEQLLSIFHRYRPTGSGLNALVALDLERSNPRRIVINCEFHHMDENGMYDGWTSHSVIFTPGFYLPEVRVTGRNKNQVKEYLEVLFFDALIQVYDDTYDRIQEELFEPVAQI